MAIVTNTVVQVAQVRVLEDVWETVNTLVKALVLPHVLEVVQATVIIRAVADVNHQIADKKNTLAW